MGIVVDPMVGYEQKLCQSVDVMLLQLQVEASRGWRTRMHHIVMYQGAVCPDMVRVSVICTCCIAIICCRLNGRQQDCLRTALQRGESQTGGCRR